MSKQAELICRTSRTSIYKITPADAAFILELLNTPDWLQNIGDRGIHSLAQAERYVEQAFVGLYQTFGFGYYVIRDNTQTSIGVVGFLKKAYLENVDFGFAFLPEYFRQGYGMEVSKAVLDYGQAQLGLGVLDAITLETNIASRGLLEKLGFTRLGNIEVPDDPAPALLYRLTDQ